MNELESQQISCVNCSGMCCTVSHNSMRVELWEALQIVEWIQANDSKKDLMERIASAIETYRLDKRIYVKNQLLRKRYTCPFFKFQSWGCPLPVSIKPLGCLAFNSNGQECSSDQNELHLIDLEFSTLTKEINLKIWNNLSADIRLNWGQVNESLPLPLALNILIN